MLIQVLQEKKDKIFQMDLRGFFKVLYRKDQYD